jgi:ankyrin repeat protein
MDQINEDLCQIIKTDQTSFTKALLKKGANINYKDKNGMSAIDHAIESGMKSQICFLMINGADITDEDIKYCFDNKLIDYPFLNKHGHKLLHQACINKNYNIVKILLDLGIDPNLLYNGNTILCLSTYHAYEDMIILLLKYDNININLINADGKTPFRIACAMNHLNITKLLLDAGADPNIKGRDGNTGLIKAIINKNMVTPTLLLTYKNIVNVNVQNKKGKTALTYAVIQSNYPLIQLLLMCGADYTLKDNNGKTILEYSKDSTMTRFLEMVCK